MKVEIFPAEIKGNQGYDLRILDPSATIADYLQAINEFIENGPSRRTRAPVRQCKGCDLCCYERIPLTYIDVLVLYRHLHGQYPAPAQLLSFLNSHAYIYVQGRAVDISLARDEQGACIFLDQTTGTCRVYQARPLVCQTYLCSPAGKNFTRLRNTIVNLGEDELVRQWLLATQACGAELYFHEGWQPRVRLSDWDPGPFAEKKDYGEVILSQFLERR
ncbi:MULTISPECIES: YkgJ family cysteine cluster protein [Carboxydocella]|uniref:Zinc-or iron-chelating domain-containing protein n=2 Tax=Carboxydocella TaxID=178898 RepID=A0A2R4N422_CARTR|nr:MULTISPECIES: YkgJ family cysteine cluster protein [Carboxydocella]AVX21741.1 Putative zinc- or iron-chelating domain-containing protein [Carboxydocella thermautotrophica]AVX32147.1 Putative zinc- or iron-chelating domain-containing protein [Carboxydocella thermautotrophica]GAW31819.1 hypothetical protein JDF658_15840 [Carboxydocella sp. JDF658]SKA10289.1 Putative zinc-or iron-chelating domain-containing protein [Carboxydocella sporoproducens DSM 16521]